MNDRDFMRYSRQILLGDIAIEGQQKLLASHVLIVGLGGLGSPAALYLAGAGIGKLTLVDDDDIHLSNLQRQILFTTDDIARSKSQVAQQRLTRLNPDIELVSLQQRLKAMRSGMRSREPMWCSTVPITWQRARKLTPPAWRSTLR